jgi:DNA-binding MarR family transcriptional regulator
MKSKEEQLVITDGFPTDPLSWLMATCSNRLRDTLAVRFYNAGYSVTPEQWAFLGCLWKQDGLSQQALAHSFQRSKVAAFHLIGKLEKQGYVVRRPDPADGRSNLVFLTPEGRAVLPALVVLAA